jgi:hypothetical protein
VGFVIKATIPSLLLVVHEVLIEGSSTAFVISVSSNTTTGNTTPDSAEGYLNAPIGHVYTQGYFHKYVAFSSFDAAETRSVTVDLQ